ncbi:MAG: helix-turn-helix domain-containing protein [Acetatifactor sp.]
MKKDKYTINEVAKMSGLTTRTIRNYLAEGQIHGEKKGGKWVFTCDDFVDMLENPYVGPAIKAKSNAPLFDFIKDDRKMVDSTCIIIDRCVDGEAEQILVERLCNLVNAFGGVEFRYMKRNGNERIILTGSEENVRKIYLELDV